jgi:hypothetical protein
LTEKGVKQLKKFDLNYTWTLDSALSVADF